MRLLYICFVLFLCSVFVQTKKKERTINKLLRAGNKELDSLIAAITSLHGTLVATIKYMKDTAKNLDDVQSFSNTQAKILNSWDGAMEDMHRFVRAGSTRAIQEGVKSTESKGFFNAVEGNLECPYEGSEYFPEGFCSFIGDAHFDSKK